MVKRLFTSTRAVLILAAFSMVLLTVTALYSIYRGREASRSLCQQAVEDREALRRAFKRARSEAIAEAATLRQTEAIVAYYAGILAEIPPLHCTSSGQLEEPSLVD